MRIVIATVQVPFISGGAESLAGGLLTALRREGHEAEIVTMPFRFSPAADVRRSMEAWAAERLDEINGYRIDRVIGLKFPAIYVQHPNKVAWLLHQHRSVYDLWETPYGADLRASPEWSELKREITERDTGALRSCKRVYTIAREVSKRLHKFNGLDSAALYHPPPLFERIYTAPAQPFVFCPSRLETLKRQDILIEAMRYTRTPLVALIAGDGGQRARLEQAIAKHNLFEKVRLLGRTTDEEMVGYYANCLAVYFGPFEEDYGYVTLEAMLAQKPVVTCHDSGGPLEFVVHGETGFVAPPDPRAVADVLDRLYLDQTRAAEMGQAGLDRYRSLGISWKRVCAELLS
jgi:glycosyltransferase involved in cell wall biosynthesis